MQILVVYQVNAITKGTDAQAEVSVRLEDEGLSVLGVGNDIDTMVASGKAYINGLNKLIQKKAKQKIQKDHLTLRVRKLISTLYKGFAFFLKCNIFMK